MGNIAGRKKKEEFNLGLIVRGLLIQKQNTDDNIAGSFSQNTFDKSQILDHRFLKTCTA
jgi:hypothetical protein